MKEETNMYQKIKRIADISFSSVALVISGPIILISIIAVRITLGKPVFFIQERPGLYGRKFKLVKIKTMSNLKEGRNSEGDKQRLTQLGKFLRASSIDELPSFINIIKGDMSLVGPRPLNIDPTEYPEYIERLSCLPGLTGYAQVNGRNTIEWEEKFRMDCVYTREASFIMDIWIILKTIPYVLMCKGISHPKHATAPQYKNGK